MVLNTLFTSFCLIFAFLTREERGIPYHVITVMLKSSNGMLPTCLLNNELCFIPSTFPVLLFQGDSSRCSAGDFFPVQTSSRRSEGCFGKAAADVCL